MTRRTRTFENVTDADLVRQVVGDHGLTPDVDVDGPTHPVVCQLNQSDLAFLRDRVLPLGADMWLDGTTLHVGARRDEPIVLRYGHELLDLRVLADVAMQVTEQRVAGWDASAKEAVLEVGGPGVRSASDLGDDVGGGGLARRGVRRAACHHHTADGDERRAEARALAAGLYRERARRFVTGSGTVDGISALRAGRSVTMNGLGAMFDGDYRLRRVGAPLRPGSPATAPISTVERSGSDDERVGHGSSARLSAVADAGCDPGRHVIRAYRRLAGRAHRPGHRQPGPRRAGPGEGAPAVGARRWQRPLRDLGAGRHVDGGQRARHLVRARPRRRGARRLRGRRPAAAGGDRLTVERPRRAAGDDGGCGNPKRTILTGAGVRITLDDTLARCPSCWRRRADSGCALDDTPASVTVEDAKRQLGDPRGGGRHRRRRIEGERPGAPRCR